MLGDEMCVIRLSLYLCVLPILVPKDIVFDINKIVTVHSVHEFHLKKTEFPEEAHLNLSIQPYDNVYYGMFFVPFHLFCPPEIIPATISAFISTSSFSCYNSLFRSPPIFQATIQDCCLFTCPYSFLLSWCGYLMEIYEDHCVRILQWPLSGLNSTQSFENEGSIKIMHSL